ncbi:MAG: hypothetical protein RMY29_029830 [Nostoc sp. CreGUA01]|nr:hypothetical protein [Nostoc sp. CreGUA01]
MLIVCVAIGTRFVQEIGDWVLICKGLLQNLCSNLREKLALVVFSNIYRLPEEARIVISYAFGDLVSLRC